MSVARRLLGHRQSLLFGFAVTFVLTFHVAPLGAQTDAKGEWPQILGPQRNGLSTHCLAGVSTRRIVIFISSFRVRHRRLLI